MSQDEEAYAQEKLKQAAKLEQHAERSKSRGKSTDGGMPAQPKAAAPL